MATNTGYKAPPVLTKDSSYENWKKEIKIWQPLTTLEGKKQALAIFLMLSGQAKEAALELELDVINADDGVNKLLEKLDGLYLKDSQTAYHAYDTFEKFQRRQTMTVQE